MAPMTITDYLINAVFVLIVFRQARERELDRRSVIIPLVIIAYVAHLYVRSIPTAGNDLVLIAALGAVGLHAGCRQRLCYPRPCWREWSRGRAGGLDRRGAADRGDRLADGVRVRALPRRAPRGRAASASLTRSAPRAWPVALVLMALLEVSTRIAIVQLRGRQRDAVQRRDPRRGVTSDLPTLTLSGPPLAGRIAFYRPHRGDRIRARLRVG